MFQINDSVVYQNEVCLIKERKEKFFNGKDYYVLSPYSDSSLTINLPIEQADMVLKPVLTKKEALDLIKEMPSIKPIISDDKMIENEYKLLLKSENKTDLVRIIKTTYLRNYERIKNGKKIGEKDETYFKKAEKLLYGELAISLGMSFDDTKQYIIDSLNHA